MKFFKDSKGVVSVFLAIILIPCIVVTFLFVDLGRIFMSASMAKSSADLALDSMLTNYDADLKEWYGIVASCQNTEEFYKESSKFFVRSMQSKGLSDDEIYLLSDYYSKTTNEDSIYDFLATDVTEKTSNVISAVEGKDLTNPAILKKQIVEFMKYRAPIELTTGIIQRLKNDKTFNEAKEQSKNEELVNKKTDFYDKEAEFIKKAYNTYRHINNYVEDYGGDNLTREVFYNFIPRINACNEIYKKINDATIKNLLISKQLYQFAKAEMFWDRYVNDKKYNEYSNTVFTSKSGEGFLINGIRIDRLINNLDTANDDFQLAIDEFTKSGGAVDTALKDYDQSYDVQWWNHYQYSVTQANENLFNAANKMLQAYAGVNAISKCIRTDVDEGYKKDEIETAMNNTKYLVNLYIKPANIKKATITGNMTVSRINSLYSDYANKIAAAVVQVFGKIKPDRVFIEFDVNKQHYKKSVSQAVAYVHDELNSIRNQLQGYINELNIAIYGDKGASGVKERDQTEKIDDLAILANEYHQKLKDWEKETNRRYNELGSEKNDPNNLVVQDYNFFHSKENKENIEFVKKVNKDSVKKLKKRLENINIQFLTITDYIDSMIYCDSTIKNIKNFDNLKAPMLTKINSNDIPYHTKELNSFVDNFYKQHYLPDKLLKVSHLKDDDYCFQINPESKEVKTPALYVFLHEKFKAANDKNKIEKGENKYEDAKKESEKSPDVILSAPDLLLYHGNGEDIVRHFSGEQKFSLIGSSLQSGISLFDNIISGNIDSIRDELYVTAYIMSMFSHSAYSNQGLYHLTEDKKELNTINYRTYYDKYDNENEHNWKSPLLTDTYNKSLRNIMINLNNNSAFEAEVEYIVYGGGDKQTNADYVRSAYLDIYGLRYPMNLISSFTNFWSKNNDTHAVIEFTATTISGMTSGIVPIPAIKTVILALLTASETLIDINRLKAGFPIEFYKRTESDWSTAMKNDTGGNESIAELISDHAGKSNGSGLYYSDYLTLFVYLGISSEKSDEMYKRISEVIEKNMQKHTKNSDFSMKKAQVYYQLNTDIRVKPMFLDMKIFESGDYKNDIKDQTDLWTYHIEQTKGY